MFYGCSPRKIFRRQPAAEKAAFIFFPASNRQTSLPVFASTHKGFRTGSARGVDDRHAMRSPAISGVVNVVSRRRPARTRRCRPARHSRAGIDDHLHAGPRGRPCSTLGAANTRPQERFQ